MNGKFENPARIISEQAIVDLADRLESAGYQGALELIREDLVPLAREKNISLIDAAWEYANPDEEQDTSYFQLFHALQKLSS
jgi:uncharacterized tellurite resistance protein B-like protein